MAEKQNQGGSLTRAQMVEKIKGGESVLVGGQIITNAADLPEEKAATTATATAAEDTAPAGDANSAKDTGKQDGPNAKK
jgi:hypothetical protein